MGGGVLVRGEELLTIDPEQLDADPGRALDVRRPGWMSPENRTQTGYSALWPNTPTRRSAGRSELIANVPWATPWSLRRTGRVAGSRPRASATP